MQPHEMRGGPADLAEYRFQLAIEDLEQQRTISKMGICGRE